MEANAIILRQVLILLGAVGVPFIVGFWATVRFVRAEMLVRERRLDEREKKFWLRADEREEELLERVRVLEMMVETLKEEAAQRETQHEITISSLTKRIDELERELASALHDKEEAEKREEQAIRAKERAEEVAERQRIEINKLKRQKGGRV